MRATSNEDNENAKNTNTDYACIRTNAKWSMFLRCEIYTHAYIQVQCMHIKRKYHIILDHVVTNLHLLMQANVRKRAPVGTRAFYMKLASIIKTLKSYAWAAPLENYRLVRIQSAP